MSRDNPRRVWNQSTVDPRVVIEGDDEEKWIAQCGTLPNARLIAAAPELLTHLRMSIEQQEQTANNLYKWADASVAAGCDAPHIGEMRMAASRIKRGIAASRELIRKTEG